MLENNLICEDLMVQFDAVYKRFGSLTALRDVSFSIPRGGIVGLLGPNGAGKTTTMRIMTGYLEPSGGTVKISEKPFLPDSIELKRNIGYLPESAPVYGDMLAWDYLVFGAALHGLDVNRRVPEVIREVGLDRFAHRRIRDLSKGFRQRVGLAYAILHDPDLLVLDEPSSGLDPNQIIEIRNLIRRIAETKTVILSTHIMQEVEALCDRVIVIHEGSIRYDGSIKGFSGSSQRVRLRVNGVDLPNLKMLLRKIPGYRDIEINEDCEEGLLCLTVFTDTDADLRPEIFRLAVEQNFTLYEMSQEQTSMEDIFRQLTQDEIEEVSA